MRPSPIWLCRDPEQRRRIPEQIVWVVTSYVIAGAIFTPLSGWLATRYGRRGVMVISVGAFVLSSVACGLATNL